MNRDESLRSHLRKLLEWEDAHVNFDVAVERIPVEMRGVTPSGLPHSAWQLLEHLRICQFDILDFCRNSSYVELSPADYWPKSAAPATEKAWEESLAVFRRDLKDLQKLAGDTAIDLFDAIPHGSGQTYLRELLLVADHNAYHVAQLVALRRSLGIWKSA